MAFFLLFASLCTFGINAVPNYQGCTTELAMTQAYCNTSLSIDDRVAALLSNLTLDEKISMISPQPQLGETCGVHTAGKASIGLPDYFWLTETNTAVAAICYTEPWKCPTTFIGPLGMGSSFNRTSWNLKGNVMGSEMRAFNNIAWHRGNARDLIGLTGFGPNLNIIRDPRFGRASELPGEDPFHSGTYGAQMVQGMQEMDSNGHPKMLAFLKHYTAYSRETNRGHDTYNISLFDMWDTYLAQYEIAFLQGNATGVMCSYNAINGHPSCFNSYILNDVLRTKWGQAHAFVTTDCGAVSNAMGPPLSAPTLEAAAAWALMNGTDLEMGSTVWTTHLRAAVDAGLATEEAVTRAAARAFRPLFLAGRFDPPELVGWSSLGTESINSSWNQQVNREAALQGMVLLKNDDGLLPLKSGSNIAVVGPMGVNQDLMSDYAGGTGEDGCWPSSGESCIITIAQAIANANTGGKTTIGQGVEVNSMNSSGIEAALDLVKAADIAVLVLGNDRSIEHEGKDRTQLNLQGLQEAFAHQVLALGKPTLLILSNAGAISIDSLVAPCQAIIESFNPAQMTPALADLIFGRENRWGKLPVTIYPQEYQVEQPMDLYDMSVAPGRTYKYYTGKALFEFGHGLSLTTFALNCDRTAIDTLDFSCSVHNTGAFDGDEVIMVYHRAGDGIRTHASHPVPLKSLIDFERVRVAVGQTQVVTFSLTQDKLMLVNELGDKILYNGDRQIIFSNGAGQVQALNVTI